MSAVSYVTYPTHAAPNYLVVEQVDPNAYFSESERAILSAFHDKSNAAELQKLVERGVSVKVRLDYGLPIDDESDFVAAFRVILESGAGPEGCYTVFGQKKGEEIYQYTKNSDEFFKILHHPEANQEKIPLNEQFISHLKANVALMRANPEHQNGTLIIASGLQDPDLVREIIALGKKVPPNVKENGADVRFRGYFEGTAASWSAILLDSRTLEVLLDEGSELENVGICGSNLLHWACAAASLDETFERKQRALETVVLLLDRGVSTRALNKLGKCPSDYAPNYLKEFILLKDSTRI